MSSSLSSTLPEVVDLPGLFKNDTPMIDVRAPTEFARGAFPGAVNLPLLDDHQREMVGKRYKEAGQNAAIELGNSLVTPDIRENRLRAWCDFIDANPAVVLYCFRGGLRSQICQQWLQEAGVHIARVGGGYKSMRQFLLHEIDAATAELPWIVLGGRTGSGKTHLLLRMARHIDLEGLANHRGSSFGKLPAKQPTNIEFENRLAINMLRLRTNEQQQPDTMPVFIEDEAKLIGRVALPQTLRERLAMLPMVILEESIETRIEVAKTDYVDELLGFNQAQFGEEEGFTQFVLQHRKSLHGIRKRLGGVAVAQATKLLERAVEIHRTRATTDAYDGFIEFLLRNYYDPMYDYQLQQKNRPVLFKGSADELYEWAQQSHERILINAQLSAPIV